MTNLRQVEFCSERMCTVYSSGAAYVRECKFNYCNHPDNTALHACNTVVRATVRHVILEGSPSIRETFCFELALV